MVYARINNPEWVDYNIYMSDIEEDKDVIIDGGRDFNGVNDDQLTCIKKLIDDYYDYNLSVYYNNSIKDFIIDMLPKKDNKKAYSYAKRMKIIPQVPQPIEIWFYKLFQFLIVYFFNFFPIGKAFDVIKTSTYHLFF